MTLKSFVLILESMDRDQWEIVSNIFLAAVDLPPAERMSFVVSASGGDPEIRREVENLLTADGQAGSYLESPPIFDSTLLEFDRELKPGDVLCGRFHIDRMLGEGGMGRVYKAFDAELRDHVALKVIRLEIAAHPESLTRFRQEVRLARQITHPNVCRTFDIEFESSVTGQSHSTVFLTMEFLHGESLAARLARTGCLPTPLALSIAKQLASGIDAAHAMGVIHRDLKPANVMLVPSKEPDQVRAVITDFGLARVNPDLSSDGVSSISYPANQPIGTLAYMAPEQLEVSQISPATDVYAYGLILFEMITGRRAFPANSLLDGLAKRLKGPAPSPKAYLPDVTEQWCIAIERSLTLHPKDRPQSALEVISILEGHSPFSKTSSNDNPFPQPKRWSRHAWSILGFSLIGLALLAAGIRILQMQAKSEVAPGTLIYVAPVENQTDEAALSSASELMRTGLTQSAQIQVIDEARVGNAIDAMRLSPDSALSREVKREIGMRLGAIRIVMASISRNNNQYDLEVDIEQPSDDPKRSRNTWSRNFLWEGAVVQSDKRFDPIFLAAVQSANEWIRHKVGESSEDIAKLDVPPEDVTTARWDALQEFTTAEALQRKQATTNAILALRNAVSLDPGFCLAWARLGDLLISNGQFKEGYSAYSHALSLSEFQRLSRKERDRIKGTFANDTGDFGAAEEAYRDYAVYYENDYQGWFYQGYPLFMLGRTDEAVAVLKKAYSIDPTRGNAPWELARVGIVKGDYNAVRNWAAVLEKQGDLGTSSYLNGVIEFIRHNYSGTAKDFMNIANSKRIEDRSWSYWLLANLEADLGNSDKTITALEAGIHENRATGNLIKEADNWIAKAEVECAPANISSPLADLNHAIQIDSSPQRVILAGEVAGRCFSKSAKGKAPLIDFLVKLGELTASEHFGVVSEIARHRIRGEIELAKGETQAALNEFRGAATIDSTIADREYLGRAYEALAKQEKDPGKTSTYRREAMDAFAIMSLHPGLSWVQSTNRLPGTYANETKEFLRLALLENRRDKVTLELMRSYLSLRPEDLKSDPELRKLGAVLGTTNSLESKNGD